MENDIIITNLCMLYVCAWQTKINILNGFQATTALIEEHSTIHMSAVMVMLEARLHSIVKAKDREASFIHVFKAG